MPRAYPVAAICRAACRPKMTPAKCTAAMDCAFSSESASASDNSSSYEVGPREATDVSVVSSVLACDMELVPPVAGQSLGEVRASPRLAFMVLPKNDGTCKKKGNT